MEWISMGERTGNTGYHGLAAHEREAFSDGGMDGTVDGTVVHCGDALDYGAEAASAEMGESGEGNKTEGLIEGYSIGTGDGTRGGRNALAPFVINQLVAAAIQRTMFDRTVDLISQPQSPNLYWALSTIPKGILCPWNERPIGKARCWSRLFPSSMISTNLGPTRNGKNSSTSNENNWPTHWG